MAEKSLTKALNYSLQKPTNNQPTKDNNKILTNQIAWVFAV